MNTTLLASKDDVIDVMLASFVVTLVLNEDEAALNEPDIFEAVNDLINAALGPNEPEIPAAVNPLPPPASNEVTLVLNEALAGVNDPLIPAAVKGEANAPEISDAI